MIAATDTVSVLAVFQAKRVDPPLFYLVFGESALNDAVALVLFNTFAQLLKSKAENVHDLSWRIGGFFLSLAGEAVGSPILGTIFGWSAALVFQRYDFCKYPHLELPLYILVMYVPFVVAECMHLSGIVAIFFSGISARRYIAPNVTEETRTSSESIFKVSAFLAESSIFLELGLSVFGLPGSFNWSFIAWAFLASLISRAIGIYPLAFLHNISLKEVSEEQSITFCIKVDSDDGSTRLETCGSIISTSRLKTPPRHKDLRISKSMMHVLWFAGLRGAVAYASVRKFPNLYGHADEFTAATIVIVLVTIIIMGGATEHVLRFLNIQMEIDEEEYMRIWREKRRLKGLFHDLGKFDDGASFSIY